MNPIFHRSASQALDMIVKPEDTVTDRGILYQWLCNEAECVTKLSDEVDDLALVRHIAKNAIHIFYGATS